MTAQGDGSEPDWPAYYAVTSTRAPRRLLKRALKLFDVPGSAMDLGCGAGVETLELLRGGWDVLAVDSQAAAIELIDRRVSMDLRDRLETTVRAFEELEFPSVDLIWSGLSLPFAAPEHSARIWNGMVNALSPGGRLVCDLFGPRHAWSGGAGMTFLTAAEIHAKLDAFDLEFFEESEEPRQTAFEGLQKWHAFELIARKR